MIVETIFSTLDESGKPNFAPMGVLWGEKEIIVRPFRQTHTYQNLLSTGFGVVNVTDDILAYVQSALYEDVLPYFPASCVPGVVFKGSCYWREVAVVEVTGEEERADVHCRVLKKGWQRDFIGFNRAQNALLEASILATRLHLPSLEIVLGELAEIEEIVRKTGDEVEMAALQRLLDFVRRWQNAGNG